MQKTQPPTQFAPLSGSRLAPLIVLSALTLTFATATAREGVVVSWPDGTSEPVPAATDDDAIAFEAHASTSQLRLVDVGQTSLPATVIDFELDAFRPLRLAVYDLEGRLVRELADGLYARGAHRMAWHHENEDGELLDDGLYVVRMHAGPSESEALALAR